MSYENKLAACLREQLAEDAECGQVLAHVGRGLGVVNQCAALSDVLTELEQIHERSSDPDARDHASSAMERMALIWITPDELDAKIMEWTA